MTFHDILECYRKAYSTNYDVSFIDEQLNSLKESYDSDSVNTFDEVMQLNIICSALKYYIETSPSGYEENITDIVDRLEQIYVIDGLLLEIIDIES